MKKGLAVSIAVSFLAFQLFLGQMARSPLAVATAQAQGYYPPYSSYPPPYPPPVLLSPEQLDNLLAPVALYPDPLLAQVLIAATFVDQVDEAARWMRAYNDPYAIDYQPWDVSVKAVAHYPPVLYMMSDRLDWTTALGQAYVNQSTDVFASIQHLRALAYSAGNLLTSGEQQVIVAGNYIQIVPFRPQVIYVPTYDPYIIYFPRRSYFGGPYATSIISFGTGFAIGAWLNRDCDWAHHRVYYHGWRGGGWIGRSRPNIHITNVYVNNNYTNIHVNQNIVQRSVNTNSLNRYTSIHRDVNYDNLRRENRGQGGSPNAGNKVIRHNMDVTDRRIDVYRGRPPVQQPAPQGGAALTVPMPSSPSPRRDQKPPQTQPRPVPPREEKHSPAQPQPPPTRAEKPPQLQARPQPQPRPEHGRPLQTPPREAQRATPSVFAGDRGGFDPRAASQRGQASRARANAPAQRPQTKAPGAPSKHQREAAPGERR